MKKACPSQCNTCILTEFHQSANIWGPESTIQIPIGGGGEFFTQSPDLDGIMVEMEMLYVGLFYKSVSYFIHLFHLQVVLFYCHKSANKTFSHVYTCHTGTVVRRKHHYPVILEITPVMTISVNTEDSITVYTVQECGRA